MSQIRHLQDNWEGFARTDPLVAICGDPARIGRRWDPETFFATGETEIGIVLDHVAALGLAVDFSGTALDFGCGVGRLTQALARRFAAVDGIDIAPTMIALAHDYNRYPETCRYAVNAGESLASFEDGAFAFIYSSIVLQHVPPLLAERYLAEFARVLAPNGVLVFQLPDRYQAGAWGRLVHGLRKRVRLRTRLKTLLAGLGLGSYPPRMEMHCIPEARVREVLDRSDLRPVDVRLTNSTDWDFNGRLVYLDREPEQGYISKQYCAVAKSRPAGG